MTDSTPTGGADRYRIRRKLAAGGMATVHLADDDVLKRPVALKILDPERADDETFVARFRGEALAAGGLRHPNVVAVYDWGPLGDSYFIAMEYVDGRTLDEVIAEGRLTAVEAAGIAAQIADGLAAAHEKEVVHRDVKPSNVMIGSAGQVKLTDFGIARAVRAGQDLTQIGMVIGTASYLSPEQAQGLPVDGRSDLYALGVVLFELLTGQRPFTGESSVGVATQHVANPPPRVATIQPSVPGALDGLVDRLLAKDPNDRYQSAAEVSAELRRIVDADSSAAPAVGAIGVAGPADTGLQTSVMSGDGLVEPGPAAIAPDGGAAGVFPRTEVMPESNRPDHQRRVAPSSGVGSPVPVAATSGPVGSTGGPNGALLFVGAVLVVGVILGLVFAASRNGSDGSEEPVDEVTTVPASTVPDGAGEQPATTPEPEPESESSTSESESTTSETEPESTTSESESESSTSEPEPEPTTTIASTSEPETTPPPATEASSSTTSA